MKNSFGNSITVTLFGESHGDMIGAVLDGLAPGIKIDDEYINKKLAKRRPSGKIATSRVEADEYKIVSGMHAEYTTGTPLCLLIPNTNTKSSDYESLRTTPRPSHADFTAECKYHGYQDARGGGHFSGRITAALVAVGAILESALNKKGIRIGTHLASLGGVTERGFNSPSDLDTLGERSFPTFSEEAEMEMRRRAEEAAASGDSVGGVTETVVFGMPSGVGEPWFDTFEGMLAHALFSIPAVKGVEFGRGFALADMLGSEANDAFTVSDGKIVTETNHSGGVLGGITSGMPITFKCAVKPTPSIYKEQKSVNLKTLENTVLKIEGRHDPSIVQRAAAVVDAVTAIVISDLLATRFGTDYLA